MQLISNFERCNSFEQRLKHVEDNFLTKSDFESTFENYFKKLDEKLVVKFRNIDDKFRNIDDKFRNIDDKFRKLDEIIKVFKNFNMKIIPN